MRQSSEKIWLTVMAASAAAACISAVIAAFSFIGKSMTQTIISAASFVLFVLCLVFANIIRSKISDMNRTEEEVRCLRLKKPGLEKIYGEEIVPKAPHRGSRGMIDKEYEEEIVPKGKMPKG